MPEPTTLDPATLDAEQTYKLLTGIVVPRPIAWVTTVSADGVANLAPFSVFTFVSHLPPMIGINVGRKAGVLKDTGNNILANGEFVVHIADDTQLEAVHRSSIEYPPEVSEIAELGLRTRPATHVRPPILVDAPVAMECRLHQSIAFGDTGSEFMVGTVLAFHFRAGLLENGKVDAERLRPICRLGGPTYARLGEIIRMQPVGQTPKTAGSR